MPLPDSDFKTAQVDFPQSAFRHDRLHKVALTAALAEGRLTRGELQRSAANICRFLLQTPAFRRGIGRTSALDDQLEAMAEQDMQQAAQSGQPLTLRDGTAIDIAAIDNGYRLPFRLAVLIFSV